MSFNGGVVNYGSMGISRSVIGGGAAVRAEPGGARPGRGEGGRADVGVITVLSEEADAVREALGLVRMPVRGLPFFEGVVKSRGAVVRVAALRALSQGQRSAVVAFDLLRRTYGPSMIVLVGIGGGVHPALAPGDVVISTRVIYYDHDTETSGQTPRRDAPAPVGRAVDAFFADYGEPARFPGYTVFTGPLGAGEAVIADVRAFNDRTLAVDMEAGGLTQAFLEHHGTPSVEGWAVVRGISDGASAAKDDAHHRIAARNAAVALRDLLPYLPARD
ncbi:hypothetical protein OIE66_07200 [Nonomuraea sp. NBC_01738]|uniref:5'-methylthioadenosine/S-adenosylhomocysteine nucleosidase family protein n=1 Tax=Nonomuraea sp. NBC_01738 TaxID=2976003 RepID=UPI002E0E0275|nr:hypothetical protein OIE66_07200 [Nonomuraea sp. NBC_01738]